MSKFSTFTLKTLAAIIADPGYDDFYLVGHSESIGSEQNFKIPIKELVAVGTIVETATLTSQTTYTITSDSELSSRNKDNIFVFLNGTEISTGVNGYSINLTSGIITFPTSISGSLKIIIFK